MIKITGKQAEEITFEDTEEFKVIEIGDWVSEGKYEHCRVIFLKGNKYYELHVSRTGSYFTDWYYCWEYTDSYECEEVEQVEVKKMEWRLVSRRQADAIEAIDWQSVADNIWDMIKCNGSITGQDVEDIKTIHTTFHHGSEPHEKPGDDGN